MGKIKTSQTRSDQRVLRLEIGSAATRSLRTLEAKLSAVLKEEPQEIEIALARNFIPRFFFESWIVAVIATCSRRALLRVVDWHGAPGETDARDRFGTNVDGLAACVFAHEITDARRKKIGIDARTLISVVSTSRMGIAEPDLAQRSAETEPKRQQGSRAKSVTFCAFDDPAHSNTPDQSLALVQTDELEDFRKAFRQYFLKYIEVGIATGHSELISQLSTERSWDIQQEMTKFIHELMENSRLHGCRDAQDDLLKGIRYLSLRRHWNYSEQQFLSRANEFPELAEYLQAYFSRTGLKRRRPYFFEVAVSDHGMGIAERLRATRPDLALALGGAEDRASLINQIIEKSLSSSLYPGSGRGLKRALDAVHALNGFLTVRTDDVWLIHSPQHRGTSSEPLLAVQTSGYQQPRMVGTHFHLLFPMVTA